MAARSTVSWVKQRQRLRMEIVHLRVQRHEIGNRLFDDRIELRLLRWRRVDLDVDVLQEFVDMRGHVRGGHGAAVMPASRIATLCDGGNAGSDRNAAQQGDDSRALEQTAAKLLCGIDDAWCGVHDPSSVG